LNPAGGPANWDATPTGLEQRALGHRDCVMPMDDVSFLAGNGKEATKLITFRLSGNRPRSRAGEYVAFQDLVESDQRIIAVSTSEDPIWENHGAKGVRGEEVRMIDVPACVSRVKDVFDGAEADRAVGASLEERMSFIDSLQVNSQKYQGKVFRAYVKRRLSDMGALRTLASYMEEFNASCPLPQQLPWLGRIRRLFAVCYASGVQASHYGLLPWTKDQILGAIKKSMGDAMNQMISEDIETHHRNGDPGLSDEAVLRGFRERVRKASIIDLRKIGKGSVKEVIENADGFFYVVPVLTGVGHEMRSQSARGSPDRAG
jgi:hypothetical protein